MFSDEYPCLEAYIDVSPEERRWFHANVVDGEYVFIEINGHKAARVPVPRDVDSRTAWRQVAEGFRDQVGSDRLLVGKPPLW